MYQLTNDNGIKRLIDDALIPINLRNRDYIAYLKWIEQGNEPLPAPPVRDKPKPRPTPAPDEVATTVREQITNDPALRAIVAATARRLGVPTGHFMSEIIAEVERP